MQTHYMTRDFSMAEVAEAPGRMPQGGQAMAKFFAGQVRDNAKSEALGRNAYRTIDMVRVIIPGDNGNVVERRVKPSDKMRWPRQWEAYQKMQEYVPDGTLLDNWPWLTRGQIEDLKYNSVFTVEQLANLSDEALQRLGLGARRMREHAQAFLETSATGAVPAKIIEENDRLKKQIDLLTQQMTQLTTKLESVAAKAGENVAEIDNPLQQIQLEIEREREKTARVTVEIPDNFEELPISQLRKICERITDERVTTKAEGIAIIQEYKERERV